MTTPFYCEATHPESPDGCYGEPNHEGPHEGIRSYHGGDYGRFNWSEPAETFTDAELAILLMSLKGAEHFFPGLVAKLTAAREALK